MAEAQNIPVGSTTAGQIAVAAESTVATRMSAPASFDVADFPVPHGREEEWRFTPLERLRGLHDGTAVATGDGVKVDVEAPEGVAVETVGRDDARIGRAGTPVDRVAAQAYSAFEKAGVITVPKETVLTEPIRIAVHGEGGTAYAHQVVELLQFAGQEQTSDGLAHRGDRGAGALGQAGQRGPGDALLVGHSVGDRQQDQTRSPSAGTVLPHPVTGFAAHRPPPTSARGRRLGSER